MDSTWNNLGRVKYCIFPGFCSTIAPRTALDTITEWADNLNKPTPQVPEQEEEEEEEEEEVEEEEEEEEEELAAAEAADAFCLVIEAVTLIT